MVFKAAVAATTAALSVGTALAGAAVPASASPPGPGRHEAFTRTVRTGSDGEAKARRPHLKKAAGEHVLKVDVLDREGKAPSTDRDSRLYVWPLNGDMPTGLDVENGHAEGPVPDGEYIVYSKIYDTAPDGRTSAALMYLPKVTIAADTALTLDARTTRPVRVTADRPDAAPLATAAVISQRLGDHVQWMTEIDGNDLYVTPQPAGGDLAFHVLAVLTRGGVEKGSPYAYNIATTAQGIPADPSVHVREAEMARVRTRYASEGAPGCVGGHAMADLGLEAGIGLYEAPGALPAERVEYYTPGVKWDLNRGLTDASCSFQSLDYYERQERFPAPGRYTRTWNTAPVAASAGTFTPDHDGQNFVQVPMLSTADTISGPGPDASSQGTTTLTDASGAMVATSSIPGVLDGWEPAKPGPHTLTVDDRRSAPWSALSTRQHIVWNLNVTDPKATLPLGVVRYRVPGLDASNRAAASARQTITLTPDTLPASSAPKLWTSTDSGTTWQPVPVTATDQGWKATFTNPPKGTVSLRAQVPGVVDQTLIDAYGLR
ncbi:hypothetical protein [Actinomadura gamaensis]|uniref:Uncharacterized protein n=1 Tax=Actinomadura gamaensis TaxID=1763541 RepID=A0ABV9UB83_9ACTN